MNLRLTLSLAASTLGLLSACSVGPNYVRPTVETPQTFKELAGWKTAQPRDQELRGDWWKLFNDPLLDGLQQQVNISNQNLALAEAQFRQARAVAQAARGGFFPLATGSVSVTRASSTQQTSSVGKIATQHVLTADVSWEADVWGRIRRTVEAGQAAAQASAADLESARLSAHSNLAQNYFALRALDSQKQLFDATLAAYEKSLQLTKNQYAVGVAARADVVQAETQLKTTQAQAIDLGVQRAQLEHAIALLIGKAPATFSIPSVPLIGQPPTIPLGLPSMLLERRPDISAAERRVAAANAQIGVAQAAFFPDLMLTASGGFQSSSFANWLTLPSRFWAVGPALAATLFDGGARRAQKEQAVAAYDGTVAMYRQTVLIAFQGIEDNLAALRILEQEATVQDEAVKAARLSAAIATNQYRAGTVSYLNVITAQTTALSNERTAADLTGRRFAASVLLVAALGGGWGGQTQVE